MTEFNVQILKLSKQLPEIKRAMSMLDKDVPPPIILLEALVLTLANKLLEARAYILKNRIG
jgi:hypothetical protein